MGTRNLLEVDTDLQQNLASAVGDIPSVPAEGR
jgi:hypothetical protein